MEDRCVDLELSLECSSLSSSLPVHHIDCQAAPVDIPLSYCLTAAENQRLLLHQKKYEEEMAKGNVTEKFEKAGSGEGAEPPKAWVTDIEQNVGYVSAGAWVPCLVKHGKLVSLSSETLFAPWEHMAIMGEDLYAMSKFVSLLAQVKADGKLKDAEVKRLAGNAFHLAAAGSFFAYVLAGLQQRGTLGSCDNLGALMDATTL